MLRPGIPEKAIKGLSIRNKRDPKKNNKTRPNQEDGRSHHEPTHYVHRYNIIHLHELTKNIEGNLLSSKIEPFANPRGKIDIKQKTVHNVEPTSDLFTSINKL